MPLPVFTPYTNNFWSNRQLAEILVNGAPGAILLEGGRPVTLASFTIIDGKIVEIDVLMDPERLALL